MKEIVNNKITYNNVLGVLTHFETFVNQGVRSTDSPTFANLSVTGNTVISGNLFVEGNTAVFNTNVSELQDNILLLNRSETSNGVSLKQAGLEIDRGLLENYRIVYDEIGGTVKIGLISNLKELVVRENTPLDKGIMTWNDSFGGIISTDNIQIPSLSFSSTQNSIDSSSGSLIVDGGIGIKKDIYVGGGIGGSDGVLNIKSNVILPENYKFFLNDTTASISSSSGNILLGANSINISTGVPLVFSGNKISTNSSGNLYLNLLDGVSIDNTRKIYLGSLDKSVSGNGNNIDINLPSTYNTKFLYDTGILFNNNGRIYDNNNLNIESLTNINLKVPVNSSINIPQNIPLNFGTNGNSITNKNNGIELSGDMTVTGNFNVLGESTIIQTQTLLVNDNLFIVNNNSTGNLSDAGLIVKRNDSLYAGVFFKETTDEFTFAYTSTQPSSSVTITDYASVRSKSLVLTSTENSTGIDTGTLIVKGGASITKTLYTDTLVTNNLQTSNISGNNVSAINQTVGNINITGEALFSNTSGNTVVVKGNATFENSINVNTLLANNSSISNLYTNNTSCENLNITNAIVSGDFNTNEINYLNNSGYIKKFNYTGWLSIGVLNDNTSTFIELQNSDSTLSVNVDINNGIPILKYNYNNSKQHDLYIYDNLKLYIYSYNNETTFVKINTNISSKLVITQEGNGTNPSSWNNTWVLLDSSFKPSNDNINAGDFNVNGKLKVNDSLPIFGNNPLISNNLGISLERFQTENDTGIGDVITDTSFYIDTLPSQTGVLASQVKLSNNANNNNDYYNGFWIKFGNQTRRIISYSGGNKIANIKSPWATNPVLGDTLYFYSKRFLSMQYNETGKSTVIGYTNDKNIIELSNLQIKDFVVNSINSTRINVTDTTNNSIISNGGMILSKDLNVIQRVIIGTTTTDTTSNLLLNNVDNKITLQGDTSTIQFTNTNSNFNIKNAGNTLSFGNNDLVINDTGNVRINGLLTLRSINTTEGTLKLSTDSEFIEIGSTTTVSSNIHFNRDTTSDGIITINNTTNSTSSSGSLTVKGGLSISKDAWINGDLYVSGNVLGFVSSPTLNLIATINCSISLYSNVNLIKISNVNELSFNVQVIPVLGSENTEFEFTLPGLVNNLTSRFDCISYASGYTDNSVIILQNILCFGKTGDTKAVVKFQSVSSAVHYIQVTCKYTI
jgi:hypothetical protein